MLSVEKTGPNRVDLSLRGSLSTDQMRTALDSLIEMSEDVTNGAMLYRIEGFTYPTVGAIGVELSRLPKLFGLLKKYDRCAVCTDTGWIRTAAEIEGALFPGMDIKAFDLDEVDAAEAWLQSGQAQPDAA